MTIRTLLASAVLLGAAAVPAHADPLTKQVFDAVSDEVGFFGGDDCAWVHHREVACVPKGYLPPVDVWSVIPPPPT
jgi:hypothetical protein